MKMLRITVALLFACALPALASTYYLSPSGNDRNNGLTTSQAWITPHHDLTCGDVIVASPSTAYDYRNFGFGQWGSVKCPTANNVVWLRCASFDACKITVPDGTHAFGMAVSASFWGIQGWEVSNLESDKDGLSCFTAQPSGGDLPSIHHIIFANNIANTCALSGFGAGKAAYGTSSVDYVVMIGNISYHAGVSNTGCGSGFNVLAPAATDTAEGTHILLEGNFAYGTVGPPNCFDANGLSFDSFDGRYELPRSYDQQAVMENNISVGNEGVGVRVQYNDSGNGPNYAHIYVLHNTTWGNSRSWNQYGSPDCGEFQMFKSYTTYFFLNLAATNQQGCYNDPDTPQAAYTVKAAHASDFVTMNWGYSPTGTNTQAVNSPDYAFGPQNVLGTDPQYASTDIPGAPNCSGYGNTAQCMATLVAGFTPQAGGAQMFGYQKPSATYVPDPFFPQWLCTVTLPQGLVSKSCQQQ